MPSPAVFYLPLRSGGSHYVQCEPGNHTHCKPENHQPSAEALFRGAIENLAAERTRLPAIQAHVPSDKAFPMLKLPPEIRLKIYDYVLDSVPSPIPIFVRDKEAKSGDESKPDAYPVTDSTGNRKICRPDAICPTLVSLRLCHVNSTMRAEVLPVLAKRTLLSFGSPDAAPAFLAGLPAGLRQTSLFCVSFDFHFDRRHHSQIDAQAGAGADGDPWVRCLQRFGTHLAPPQILQLSVHWPWTTVLAPRMVTDHPDWAWGLWLRAMAALRGAVQTKVIFNLHLKRDKLTKLNLRRALLAWRGRFDVPGWDDSFLSVMCPVSVEVYFDRIIQVWLERELLSVPAKVALWEEQETQFLEEIAMLTELVQNT